MVTIKIKPLSVNQAYRGRRYKTAEYKAYEKQLGFLLPAHVPIPEGDIKIVLEVGFSSRGSDLDNAMKQFLDILSKCYNFNDNRVSEIHLYKNIVKKGEEYIAFEIL